MGNRRSVACKAKNSTKRRRAIRSGADEAIEEEAADEEDDEEIIYECAGRRPIMKIC